jgi:hypothetical protein
MYEQALQNSISAATQQAELDDAVEPPLNAASGIATQVCTNLSLPCKECV